MPYPMHTYTPLHIPYLALDTLCSPGGQVQAAELRGHPYWAFREGLLPRPLAWREKGWVPTGLRGLLRVGSASSSGATSTFSTRMGALKSDDRPANKIILCAFEARALP